MSESDDIFAAVGAGDVLAVREILRKHPRAARERDADGATALHYAAESGNRAIVDALLEAGADINARDAQFDATPTGWAIEYLRERGGLLAIEIEDALDAIQRGDVELVRRYLARFPSLRGAIARDGTPLRERAKASGSPEITGLFEV